MAEQSTGRVVLMAIRPEFAEQILAGTKTVEFRKRRLASDVSDVVLYASAPVSAVVGSFVVARQETEHPKVLWDRFSRVGGIEHLRYVEYFGERELGTGIVVGAVRRLAAPMNLGDLGISHAPQSFLYLTSDVSRTVLGAMVLV
ncbi:hypothetical protein [Cellulomonas sp. GbtcB1]|uniref:hypothetical protein n=1 Tax=Cellulomonas sp. GbtcB1 TaxID=2824746 RepID=UPI001C30D6A6|nr:hypothetical protein [Cellulomonas sp. GbtcB1]